MKLIINSNNTELHLGCDTLYRGKLYTFKGILNGKVWLKGLEGSIDVDPQSLDMTIQHKPNKPGIWEWFDAHGKKRLVSVCECSSDPNSSHLRVSFQGGYYNIKDECVGTWEEEYNKAEWPDNWGEYIGEESSIPNTEKYWWPDR